MLKEIEVSLTENWEKVLSESLDYAKGFWWFGFSGERPPQQRRWMFGEQGSSVGIWTFGERSSNVCQGLWTFGDRSNFMFESLWTFKTDGQRTFPGRSKDLLYDLQRTFMGPLMYIRWTFNGHSPDLQGTLESSVKVGQMSVERPCKVYLRSREGVMKVVRRSFFNVPWTLAERSFRTSKVVRK